MDEAICCNDMKYHIEYKCDIHKDVFECPDNIIYQTKTKESIGIIIHDGGNSFIEINYCPWCGTELKK